MVSVHLFAQLSKCLFKLLNGIQDCTASTREFAHHIIRQECAFAAAADCRCSETKLSISKEVKERAIRANYLKFARINIKHPNDAPWLVCVVCPTGSCPDAILCSGFFGGRGSNLACERRPARPPKGSLR